MNEIYQLVELDATNTIELKNQKFDDQIDNNNLFKIVYQIWLQQKKKIVMSLHF